MKARGIDNSFDAEYEMLYPEDGQVMSGMVNFLDEDGIWRIFFF